MVRPGASADLAALLAGRHPGLRVVIVSDATVAAAIACPIDAAEQLTFPAGERHKTRASWSQLTDQLVARHCGRDTVLVALGDPRYATQLGLEVPTIMAWSGDRVMQQAAARALLRSRRG